jgi:hypothetical protein
MGQKKGSRCKLTREASARDHSQHDARTQKLIVQMIRAITKQAKPNQRANQPARDSDTDATMQRDSIMPVLYQEENNNNNNK